MIEYRKAEDLDEMLRDIREMSKLEYTITNKIEELENTIDGTHYDDIFDRTTESLVDDYMTEAYLYCENLDQVPEYLNNIIKKINETTKATDMSVYGY